MTIPRATDTDPAIVWLGHAAGALRRLSESPPLLFVVAWAASALGGPYANLAHDAKLYGLLVLNRSSGGAFADDLFLRFGSQDRYSPFSLLAAPLAGLLGVDSTFFLLFLVFNALLIYAMQQLVTALLDDTVLSSLAVLLMAMLPLPYGGLGVFQVHEAFFTPRVIGCALALLGLAQSLRQHHGRGLGLTVAATIVHPLMGFGALIASAGCAAFDLWPRARVWWLIAMGASAAMIVIGVPALGIRVFGTMDAEWLDVVRRASAYNFPQEWTGTDWLRQSIACIVVVSAALCMLRESPRRASLLLVIAGTAVVGVLATVVAVQVPYRLLLQVQPYRALWILVAVHVPLVLWLARRAWRHGRPGQVLAVVLIGGALGVEGFLSLELAVLLLPVPLFIVLERGLRTVPRRPDWLVRSLAGGLIVGGLGWGLLRVAVITSWGRDLLEFIDPLEYGRAIWARLGPPFWLGGVIAGLTLIVRAGRPRPVAMVAALVLVVAVHGAMFFVPRISRYRAVEHPYHRDVDFVGQYLARQPSRTGLPTVYAGAWDNVEYLWFDLGVKSYYDLSQLVGVIFVRQTAVEALRRAEVVRRFELDRYQRMERFSGSTVRVMMSKLLRPERGAAAPTRADLRRLCRPEEGVDVAVLRQDFGDLSSASNGRVYIYECARVRATATAMAGMTEERRG